MKRRAGVDTRRTTAGGAEGGARERIGFHQQQTCRTQRTCQFAHVREWYVETRWAFHTILRAGGTDRLRSRTLGPFVVVPSDFSFPECTMLTDSAIIRREQLALPGFRVEPPEDWRSLLRTRAHVLIT